MSSINRICETWSWLHLVWSLVFGCSIKMRCPLQTAATCKNSPALSWECGSAVDERIMNAVMDTAGGRSTDCRP